MGSEDFAFLLREKPGCYIWLGNGPTDGGCLLHNPHYDFNDDILTVGASYWARLVESALPAG
jgi:hippurate hydrolase